MQASNNYFHLLSPYYVPSTMLSTLLYEVIYISHIMFTTALDAGPFFIPILKIKELREVQRGVVTCPKALCQ